MAELRIDKLQVAVAGQPILRGVSLVIRSGEIRALMGPNGSGKSTLAMAVMGHPAYRITSGHLLFNGRDITKSSPDQRARLGLFLGFQYPSEIPGISFNQFLRAAYNARQAKSGRLDVAQFQSRMQKTAHQLNLDQAMLGRSVNEGFSGGERKKSELAQLDLLNPALAILDEVDSGLDVDALKTVAAKLKLLVSRGVGLLIITHYQRIFNYLKPDSVAVMAGGRVVRSGGSRLALELDAKGYSGVSDRGR